jgi:glycosyltransferase involved in cell wall biosynthesis
MNTINTIYYLIPNIQRREFIFVDFCKAIVRGKWVKYLNEKCFRKPKPVGGIKVSYQHCMLLKELGYDVYPLVMGDYVGNFFGFDIETKHIKDIGYNLNSADIVVSSEFFPYEGLQFKNATKVLFMQNWFNLDRRLADSDRDKSYFDLGYNYVITCGEYCSEMVYKKMGIPATTITNGIDQDKFIENPELRVRGRVLALPRKNPQDLSQIIETLVDNGIDFRTVDGLTESELIKEYQQADIFLSTGYPEGFSLPPLEAMSCGCAVVGFTGGGANEFMIDNVTALVAQDGDCSSAASKLLEILTNEQTKENIRSNGMKKAGMYTLDRTKQQLLEFYSSIKT